MRACLAMKLASIHRETMVSFEIAQLIDGDDRRPTSISNNIDQKLSQNPSAACGLGGHKADAVTLCLSDKNWKCYSELIMGAPPASRMMSAKSSAKTSAPLADSGATKLMRSVDAENVSLVRVDVIFRQT